ARSALPLPAGDGRRRMSALLSGMRLVKRFRLDRSRVVHAVSGVDFEIAKGEVVGLVGESGSGKTTLSKLLLRLLAATEGAIAFDGKDVTHAGGAELRAIRKRMQVVFQDPFGSLNPRMTVEATLGEALRFHGIVPAGEVRAEIDRLLDLVGLPNEANARY